MKAVALSIADALCLRQHGLHHLQAVLKTFPKPTLFHQAVEVPIRRHDHTRLCLLRLPPTDGIDLTVLEDREDLGLGLGLEFMLQSALVLRGGVFGLVAWRHSASTDRLDVEQLCFGPSKEPSALRGRREFSNIYHRSLTRLITVVLLLALTPQVAARAQPPAQEALEVQGRDSLPRPYAPRLAWTANSRRVVYAITTVAAGKPSVRLRRVAAEGGEPQSLGPTMEVFGLSSFSLHPDGRQIAITGEAIALVPRDLGAEEFPAPA